jgi:DNA polymerase III gamma/tau subunit
MKEEITFSDIIGHAKNIEKLNSDIKNSNISHAYLFSGPSGVGKFTIAQAFMNALNKINNEGKNSIDSYILDNVPIEKEDESDNKIKHTNIDLKQRKTETISIDDVQIILHLANQGSFSKFKIIIIKKIERMTKSAQNALLKTLEETPVKDTIFILTTDILPMIAKTIISRCRLIHFSTVPDEEIISGIEKHGFKAETIKKILSIIPNIPGKILHLLRSPNDLETYSFLLDNIKRLLEEENNIVDRFKFVEQIYKSKESTKTFIDMTYYYLYNKFLSTSKNNANIKVLEEKIEFLQKSKMYLRSNISPRLILENIMLLV